MGRGKHAAPPRDGRGRLRRRGARGQADRRRSSARPFVGPGEARKRAARAVLRLRGPERVSQMLQLHALRSRFVHLVFAQAPQNRMPRVPLHTVKIIFCK